MIYLSENKVATISNMTSDVNLYLKANGVIVKNLYYDNHIDGTPYLELHLSDYSQEQMERLTDLLDVKFEENNLSEGLYIEEDNLINTLDNVYGLNVITVASDHCADYLIYAD